MKGSGLKTRADRVEALSQSGQGRAEVENAPAPAMTEVAAWWSDRAAPAWVWASALVTIALWIAARLGLHHVWRQVTAPDGIVRRLPDTFATIDHPFHATRAETLRRALLDGDLLRWIAHHQGGYPVEFYPLGVAWLEVALWAVTFGTLPIAYLHKVVVVAIFVLPGLAYWLLARRDALSPAVAVAALMAHVAVPGHWWHGGYTELVLWGLVTNVAAAVAILFVLWGLTGYLRHGQGVAGAVACLASAFAVSSNPRSLIALGVVGAGVWLACLDRAGERAPTAARVTLRLGVVTAVAAALAAPELVSLVRFSDLYFFVRYTAYAGLGDYLRNSVGAVSPPVAALGLAGVGLGFWLPGRTATRAAAVSLSLYVAVTATLSEAPREAAIVDQLEATRLMPFQRLLTIYLAAVALDAIVRAVFPRRRLIAEGLVVVAALGLLLAYVRPAGPIQAEREGIFPIQSAATAEQADFITAIESADERAAPAQALLVLGTTLGPEFQWHQQLWAPFETDRPLFYDNWLWYWQTQHAGPYDYHQGNAYLPFRVPETLERDYLDRHGIGAVVVTGEDVKDVARSKPYLELVRVGIFDVYLVSAPAPLVQLPDDARLDVTVENGRIEAAGDSGGGEAKIARNWHPRWEARVNGEPVPITRTADGYMTVPLPAGRVDLVLVYAVDGWDWLGRLLAVAGLAGVVGIALGRVRWHQASRGASEAPS